ncbi:MAG: hypothetical protein Q9209_004491 [Squamulea sp. 1 TL-2023]
MFGDPQLDPENPKEWLPLIMKCLPCKTLSDSLRCTKDAKCLEHVASLFEEFTVNSHDFQLSNSAEPKKKGLLKLYRHTETHRCICSANLTVRMWSTTSDENEIPPGEGGKKHCAFHGKSQIYQHLISIPNVGAQLVVSNNSTALQIEPSQKQDGEDTSVSLQDGAVAEQVTNPLHQRKVIPISRQIELPSCMTSQNNISGLGNTDLTPLAMEPSPQSIHPVMAGPGLDPTIGLPGLCSPVEPTEKTDSLPEEITDGPEIVVGKTVVQGSGEDTPPLFGSMSGGAQQRSSTAFPFSQLQRSSRSRRCQYFSTRIPRRDEKFIFREEIIDSLEDLLVPPPDQTNDDVMHLNSGRLVSIYGEPGVGKTAIAVELSYRIQPSFDHVLWLRANDEIHLSHSIHEAARSLELTKDRANHDHEYSRIRLLEWLSNTQTSWLLIFDDADQPEILRSFLPEPCLGTILITTRRRMPSNIVASCSERIREIKISCFGMEEAISFLKYLGDGVSEDNLMATHADHKFIAEMCRGVPLALRAAGKLSNRQKILDMRTAMGHYVSGVLSPHNTAVRADLSSRSCALAAVVAFLDPYGIDDATLLSAQRYGDFPLPSYPLTDRDYFDAKDELLLHALCREVGYGSFDMHRVTQSALRAGLNPVELRLGFHSASMLLNGCWPSKRKMKHIVLGNWPEFDSLHGHVSELSRIFLEFDYSIKDTTGALDLLNDAYTGCEVKYTSTKFATTPGYAIFEKVTEKAH